MTQKPKGHRGERSKEPEQGLFKERIFVNSISSVE